MVWADVPTILWIDSAASSPLELTAPARQPCVVRVRNVGPVPIRVEVNDRSGGDTFYGFPLIAAVRPDSIGRSFVFHLAPGTYDIVCRPAGRSVAVLTVTASARSG